MLWKTPSLDRHTGRSTGREGGQLKTHEVKRLDDEGRRTKSPLTGEESGLMHHVKSQKASAGKGGFQGLARVGPAGPWAGLPSIRKDREPL